MNRRAVAIALGLAGVAAQAGDWPTYRHDAARSAWSAESPPAEPTLRWRRRAAVPPRPAWPAPAAGNVYAGLERLSRWDTSDHAFHAVIASGRVLFGSSADDSVHCLDAADGRPLWRHHAGGPVRMPPAVHDGLVYAGSDDGFVRCLRLADGAEVWRRRIGPEDRRLPGNARMISRWPIRAGPLVHEGRVLVAAGVFPLDGVFLAALDGRTGAVGWRRSIDAVAHGPLVVLGDRVVVSALRANPSTYALADGAPLGGVAGAGPVALAYRDTLVAGPAETGAVAGIDAAVQQALAVRDGFQCATRDGRLAVASDRTLAVFWADRRLAWKVERAATTALAAGGETIVVGGPDLVAGHAVADGARRWEVAVEGRPLGLALTGGRLVVSTDQGDVWCFGAAGEAAAAAPPVERPVAGAEADPRLDLVRRLVMPLGAAAGYALVSGPAAEELGTSIGRHTPLQAIGLVADDDLAAGRGRLAAAGLLGHRVTLESAAAGPAAYDDGVFNLVVVEPAAGDQSLAVAEAARLVAPGRGLLAVIGAAAAAAADGVAERAGLDPLPAAVDMRLFRARPRPGAGAWTHPFADPGNTSCSGDALVKPPFEVHWFGPPGPEAMVDRHNRTTPPLFRDGRLFVAGFDAVICADAANGAPLWRRPLPAATRLAVSKNCGNMVVGPAELFVAYDDACVALAVDSGRETRRWQVPDAAAAVHEWGYVAVVDGVLLGSRSPREADRRRIGPRSWEWGYLDHTPVVTS
ncbi:MAG: hypothetical protein FJ284_10060, partial [Planctomycetes bacterium]|nr:hypothetical protein [Planctomycetota bacterium]